eukprot:CAMPEP_0184337450 /NCGR_PEP_ID=MMETSP1089-20130417/5856_1 /TAXON_ID=38269 ORGANISM="Gloeochaete wittrockiana, Strain SAG46.84" /NCGR_SAMPLE_ID=MMETSP1089 /ASSEMBLY_ACC=CAM_ASM_000445 /LENGTH=58 /DNA_ID=CAMNT_0026663213 /DNA_START=122 /DNA_END=295 /DNA_ORIENTATION=-
MLDEVFGDVDSVMLPNKAKYQIVQTKCNQRKGAEKANIIDFNWELKEMEPLFYTADAS